MKKRHEHKDLVREDILNAEGDIFTLYCKDVHSMSIADIVATINYCKEKVKESGLTIDNSYNSSYCSVITELEAYMFEFTKRLSNRTRNFSTNKSN